MKITFRLIPACVLSLVIASNAHSSSITFDELAGLSASGSTNIGNVYSGNGFTITGAMNYSWPDSGFHATQANSQLWTGSPGLTYYGVGAKLELKSSDGMPFSLNSIDISRGDTNSGLIPVTFTGLKMDGSKVFQTYWFHNYQTGNNETFLFDERFVGLSALRWEQGALFHQFDNIAISAVPEPSTAALIFSGLMLLAFIKKQRYLNT